QQTKAELRIVQAKGRRWANDLGQQLAGVRPKMPPGLEDRQEDNAEPLLAIAELAGSDLAAIASSAVTDHYWREREVETPDGSRQLLADVVRLFAARGQGGPGGFIRTDDVVNHLVGLDEREWSEFDHGRPISKHGVSRLLKP